MKKREDQNRIERAGCFSKYAVKIAGLSAIVCLMTGEYANPSSALEPDEAQWETASDSEAVPDYDKPLPSDYEGTLTMWGWDDEYYRTITDAFLKYYPNVTFEYVSLQNRDLVQRYETELVLGGELPDIAWAVVDSRGEAFELDMWEHLDEEPYHFELEEVYDYLHPHLVNSKGNVCGIEQSLSPAGLAYRRDLAKQYLGTDDPRELEEMMPDWQSFIEKGKEVYEKSGGEVYMWSGLGDVRQFLQEQQEKAWTDGNTIDVEGTFGKSIRLVCEFRDEHISDNLISWTPSWNASFEEDHHIFTACASWSVRYTIETYDTEGGSTGRWGLMSAPEGNANWGGTAMGITKTCKDKRLAWEFLRFATLSTEGAEALNSMGLMTAAKRPYEEEPELKSYQSGWFGDQDIGAYYMDNILPNIKTRNLTPEDNVIHDRLSLILNVINKDRTLTADEALDILREELKRELPDFTVY
ncbi:MAG: extracellular solute-binding protein [Lachnospiraceae bacterium]|nr:extracellular solute-binding protein [Robinsoniella sp.]MDY3766630.1 extracellular solute-binding protein [Lachnospiraceae bacterium]